jgi:Protein of unknown function, DUF481
MLYLRLVVSIGGVCKFSGLIPRLLFFLAILLLSLPVVGQKTDTLFLYNGDRIIGEVKGLRYEILTFSTTGAGLLKIKWHYVMALKSSKLFEVHMNDGSVFYGSIDSNSIDNNIFQLLPGLKEDFDLHSIIELIPIKRTFKNRIDADVDLGFSYTKASNVSNVNLGGSFSYRARQHYMEAQYNLINTFQGNENETARKQDLKIQYVNFLKSGFFYQAFSSFEQNSELGLESRFNLGTTMGYQLLSSKNSEILFSAGPQISTETPLDDQPIRQNFEGIVLAQAKFFRVIDPELDIFLGANYIPSFSIQGRYRISTDISARIELISNFFFKLTFYSTFDSNPVAEAASNNDYGVTSSISYSF